MKTSLSKLHKKKPLYGKVLPLLEIKDKAFKTVTRTLILGDRDFPLKICHPAPTDISLSFFLAAQVFNTNLSLKL